jgi:RND family efflux transporter MFP subunit
LSVLALAGCTEAETSENTVEVLRPVKVVEVKAPGTTRSLDYSGQVRARREMALGFRVSGKITERLVDVGDRVVSGDVLARLDTSDYELQVRSAEANVAAAERQVETTELALQRARDLFAKNVASKSSLEQAELSYNQAVAARDDAASTLDQSRNQVRYTDLTAAENGIVTETNGEVGQVVSSGTPVMTVAVDGEKEVLVAVPETDILAFQPGKAVDVGFWSYPGLGLTGKVREVAGSADLRSRTFAVRIGIPAEERVLLGMTATVRAAADADEALVTVPLTALAEKDRKPIVWTVDPARATVHARDIEVASFDADGVRIAKGLSAGDLVVAAGTQFMTEDLKVKLQSEVAQSALSASAEHLTMR